MVIWIYIAVKSKQVKVHRPSITFRKRSDNVQKERNKTAMFETREARLARCKTLRALSSARLLWIFIYVIDFAA